MLTMCTSGERGAIIVPREQLPTEVERPNGAGSRWRGVPHRDLAEGFVDQFTRKGCEIVRDQWATSNHGRVLVGGIDLRLPDVPEIPGQEFSVSIMHANNMSKSMRVAVGARLMICFNGVQTGDFVLERKHTSGLRLGHEILNSVERSLNEFNETHRVIEGMKARRVMPRQLDSLFMEMGRKGILPWSAIGKAWQNYVEPPHDEFKEFDGRAWGVYQAANATIKQRSPMGQMESLKGLTELLKAS